MATTQDLLPQPDPAARGDQPGIHGPPVGTRCGLIAGADADRRVLRVLGYGRCRGADIPPADAGGTISSRFRRRREAVAFFVLEDGGETVWASECRWLDPAAYERYVETLEMSRFTVERLSAARLREELGRVPDDEPFPA